MPYNTRRKSLSLPSLGIHIPVSLAERAAAAAARTATRPTTSRSPSEPSASLSPRSSNLDNHSGPPPKKAKRAHSKSNPIFRVEPKRTPGGVEATPPPFPDVVSVFDNSREGQDQVEAANDDIVDSVLAQLRETRNRPHLAKELSAVLSLDLVAVQQSANPCALISSRLASYMRRPTWSADRPCPLAKELEASHPRRTHYFLSNCPRLPQRFSPPTELLRRIILSPSPPPLTLSPSPPPSTGSSDDDILEDLDFALQRHRSSSPEVDLYSPNLERDDGASLPLTPVGSIASCLREREQPGLAPLEKDEREFTQTADVLSKRKFNTGVSGGEQSSRSGESDVWLAEDVWDDGRSSTGGMAGPLYSLHSPAMRPVGPALAKQEHDVWSNKIEAVEWDLSPETIELEELDYLLGAC